MLGPNTAGLVVPGQSAVGIMSGFASNIFRPGRVGVLSRSGSLGTLVSLNLVDAGYGQSAFIGIGGDPILGTTTRDVVREFDADDGTDAVVLVGEIGGTMEEDAAELIATMSKPVVAFIAGRSAPADTRMGHAGAIISGTRGTGRSKVDALTGAGVTVVDVPGQIPDALRAKGVLPDVDRGPVPVSSVVGRPAHDAMAAPACLLSSPPSVCMSVRRMSIVPTTLITVVSPR